ARHFVRQILTRQDEVSQLNCRSALLFGELRGERPQLEEVLRLNVALLDGLLVEHFTGNPSELDVNARLCRELLRGFIQLEGEVPSENVRSSVGTALARGLPRVAYHSLNVGKRNRRVDGANVDKPPRFDAVNPSGA